MKPSSICRARVSWIVPLVVAYGMVVSDQAQAELLMRFRQTGSSVTATLSGTIDASWPTPTFNDGFAQYVAAGGYNGSGVQFARAGSVTGYDQYTVVSPTISPSIATLTGAYFLDFSSEATSGGSTSYAVFYLDENLVSLVVPQGVTIVDASWVWSNKQLADFFFEPNLVLSTFSDLGGTLGTLQIEGVPEIDPAGFGSVAALITGALGLIERRRLKAKAA